MLFHIRLKSLWRLSEILPSDLPCFTSAEEMAAIVIWFCVFHSGCIRVHPKCIYTDEGEKKLRFFPIALQYIRIGRNTSCSNKLSTSLDPAVDDHSGRTRDESCRLACLEWLSHSGAEAAWWIPHTTAKVSAGPLPRKKQLDYFCMSKELFFIVYKD